MRCYWVVQAAWVPLRVADRSLCQSLCQQAGWLGWSDQRDDHTLSDTGMPSLWSGT